MKYLLITINILIVFFTGCVDTYTVKDFNSPKEFYDRINEKVQDRTVKVVADSNHVYEADSLTVRPDSIFFKIDKLQRLDELKSSYRISEIKKMSEKTTHNDKIVHVVFLNNGDIITSKSIFVKDDSLFLYDIIPGISRTKKNISLVTSEVNLVSFNNRWMGLGEGIIYYSLVGILVGIRNADITSGDREAIPPELAAIAGAIVFGIGGAVVGVIAGSYQEYIINNQINNSHGFTSIRLVGGINTSAFGTTLNGNNSYSDLLVDYTAGITVVWSFNNELGIKSGILFSSKGGGFDQYIASESFTYHRDVFVNQLEIPLLFQYTFKSDRSGPRIYAGPQINFFRNGRIDNLYDIKQYYSSSRPIYYSDIDSRDVNSPNYSFVIGAGLNFHKYFTVDFQYEYGLSKFSNSLFDGQVTNLKFNSFSILLGYGL